MRICIIGHAIASQAILEAMAGKNFDAIIVKQLPTPKKIISDLQVEYTPSLNGWERYSKSIYSENKPNPRPLFGKCPDDVFGRKKRRF